MGNASYGLHSICPMIDVRCGLGGCCKGGGSKQQTGLQLLSLAAGGDKGPVEIGALSHPAGRNKNCSRVCCFDTPPPLPRYNSTLHHVSIPGMAILEIQKRFSWVLKGFVWSVEGSYVMLKGFSGSLNGFSGILKGF